MASSAFPNLQAKKVDVSWADQMDEIDFVKDLADQEMITLEEFARLIRHFLLKCELDTNKTAHHFQIEDMFVDLMYRDHVVISVSKKHKTESPESTSATEEDEDVEDAENQDTEDEDKNSESSTEKNVLEQPPAMIESATEEPTGWTQVESKKTKQRRSAREFVEREGQKAFYFFCNEANASYMDFVGMVTGLDQLIESGKNEMWSHGYCVEENVVYDFNDTTNPGAFRYFIPNTAYLHKFKAWFETFEESGKRVPDDVRKFYLFKENSTWPKWTYVGFIEGLNQVRRVVQANKSEFGHAYCLDTNDLVNFWLTDGHFHQRQSKAPIKYIDRFQAYLEKLKPQ